MFSVKQKAMSLEFHSFASDEYLDCHDIFCHTEFNKSKTSINQSTSENILDMSLPKRQ